MLRYVLSLLLALAFARRGLRSGSLSTNGAHSSGLPCCLQGASSAWGIDARPQQPLTARRRRRRLSRLAGAAAAALVGTLHMASGLHLGATLIAFYLSSSKLTKWRAGVKARLEAGHAVAARRGAAQVLANSLPGAALSVALAWLQQQGSSAGTCAAARVATAAFVGFYGACCADTWSSEAGIVSSAPPRLITTWRRVPPGTNGGISALGTAAAAAGGLFVGAVFVGTSRLAAAWTAASAGGAACHAAAAADWRLLPLAVAAGLGGSLLDSVLGATLQWSGYDTRSKKAVSRPPVAGDTSGEIKHTCGRDVLSNTGVNVVSSLLASAAAAAWAWGAWRLPIV